ncbi:MAG: bifunctional folylpolyglutamate synthase/dihydrofolate synthase, partial [Octadecabacter sp.]
AETPADFTLLEVGLGGRLDATNVMDPAVTIITPVDLDHQQFLGDTLAEIAGEKAGIIKRGVPCVVGPQHDEAMDVIERTAARLGAPLIAYGQHFHVSRERDRLIYQDETGLLDLPLPVLPGPHQIQNAGAVLATLRHLGMGEHACEAAMTRATWPARMQRVTEGALVNRANPAEIWLDGGHNPAAGKAIAATLATLPSRPTHLICGMLNTKDVKGFMEPLAAHAQSLTAVAIPGEANTLPAQTTADAARAAGIPASTAPDIYTAIDGILEKTPNARILFCGSLYFAGHVIRENV